MEAGPNDTGAGVAQQIADLMNERMDHSLKLKMPIKENFEFQEDDLEACAVVGPRFH